MNPAELLGFIGGGIGMFYGVPQALRIRRLGHGTGVSLPTWLLTFGVSTSWAAWGFGAHSPSALIMNIGGALVNGSVVVAIMPSLRKAILYLLTITAALWFLILTLPDPIVSALLIALVFCLVPQVLESLRSLQNGTTSAVSIRALAVALLSNIFWIAYAFVREIHLVFLTSGIAMTMILIVSTLELLSQRKIRMGKSENLR
ncbi:MAG: hypothetical protein NTZ06_02435 [Actinobacteria bacterium]|nr:hypothetical protein [Actinomycetota bacterium]